MPKSVLNPIDAFIKYFLNIKPYHTKLLEIIQTYNFNEIINAAIGESLYRKISLENRPLCKATGFGVDFDDACGFDADECCDLFQCLGGYGIIFDNSDLLVSVPILSIDNINDTITISGDWTYDKKINIKSIPNNKNIIFEGNHQNDFLTNELFLLINRRVFPIVNTSTNSVMVQGNCSSNVLAHGRFRLYGAGENSGKYVVLTANYNLATNITTVEIASETKQLTSNLVLGFLEVEVLSRNQGVYTVANVAFNGINTTVTINETFNFIDNTELQYGCVQLRSGLMPNRVVNIENNTTDNNGERKILLSSYDRINDVTFLQISGKLANATTNIGTVNLYGYMFGAGFDENEECSSPKPVNIAAELSERLIINIFGTFVTPTVTPTTTPTPSLTQSPYPTPSNTRSVTPSVTASVSITPTITPTISVTPSITPTISVTPSILTSATSTPTNTPTISLTPSATLTPTPSLTPTNTTTRTPTVTQTPSLTPSITTTRTPTITPTATITATPTVTPSQTMTPSITPTNTPTFTPTNTVTPTITVTPSMTPTITVTQTPTLTTTPSLTPSISISPTPTITPTNTTTASITPTNTVTPTITNTPSITATPTVTVTTTTTPTPTITATPSITPSVTRTLTPSPTPAPSATSTPTPSLTPSATPSHTPAPSSTPSLTPTSTPSSTPAPSITPSSSSRPLIQATVTAGVSTSGPIQTSGFKSGTTGSVSPTTYRGFTITGLFETLVTTTNSDSFNFTLGQGAIPQNQFSTISFTDRSGIARSFSSSAATSFSNGGSITTWAWNMPNGTVLFNSGAAYTFTFT